MKENIFNPNYDHSILALSSSILKKYNISTPHTSLPKLDELLKKYKNIVLIIFDGMGKNILEHHLNQNTFLRKKTKDILSSVFPPTTTAATNSIHSGLAPIEHGWLGWMQYFKEHDQIIELFTNKAFYTQKQLDIPPVSKEFLDYQDIYSKITEKNPNVYFERIFPSWYPNGVSSVEELRQRIVNALKTHEQNIILGYWTDPDSTIHHNGCFTKKINDIMQNINLEMENLSKEIDEETLVLITADHGIIDIQAVFINDFEGIEECLKRPPTMELRTTSFFIKKDKKEKFKNLFDQYFKEDFLLFSHDEFIQSGLLGKGSIHKKVNDFIGDFVSVGFGKRALTYYDKSSPNVDQFKKYVLSFTSDHAGISKEEMEVPLIIFKKNEE